MEKLFKRKTWRIPGIYSEGSLAGGLIMGSLIQSWFIHATRFKLVVIQIVEVSSIARVSWRLVCVCVCVCVTVLLRYHTHKIHSFKVYGSVAFSIFTELNSHHNYLILGHFLQEETVPIRNHFPHLLPSSHWKPFSPSMDFPTLASYKRDHTLGDLLWLASLT